MDEAESQPCVVASLKAENVGQQEESMVESTQAEASIEKKAEGLHMRNLRNALDKFTKKCSSAIKFEKFARCYPELAKHNLAALRNIHRQNLKTLMEAISAENEVMLKEEEMVDVMNKLDNLLDSSDSDPQKVAWRPSREPQADVAAHVLPILQQQRNRLVQILQKAEQDNVRLQRTLEKQGSKLNRSAADVKSTLDGLAVTAEELSTADVVNFIQKNNAQIKP